MHVIASIKKSLIGFLCISIFSVGVFPIQKTFAATWFWTNSYVSQIWVPWTEHAEDETWHSADLLNIIRNFINWTLWMLATIALVICLYAWFKMLTAWSDDGKYKDGFKLIKNAWLGLLIIGLSWMIVSFIMWVIQNLTAES